MARMDLRIVATTVMRSRDGTVLAIAIVMVAVLATVTLMRVSIR